MQAEQQIGRDVHLQQSGGYVEHHRKQQAMPVETPHPKPLFEGPTDTAFPPRGFEGGIEEHDRPPFHTSPRSGIIDQREGAEGIPHRPSPARDHFPRARGPHGPTSRGGFRPRMGGERFHSPRGHGTPQPRFSPRGTPFRPRVEGHSPRSRDQEERVYSSHEGPTEEKFSRDSIHEESRFHRNFPRDDSETVQHRQASYIEQLEAVKKQELEKKIDLKRELEKRQLEIKKKLEEERKQRQQQQQQEEERQAQRKREEAERAKQRVLERKRLEKEAAAAAVIAQREEEELEKKRQIDLQLAQEIENKKREMERILAQKEQMERELMEKQVQLGRMGVGGGEEGWTAAEYHSEQQFGDEQEQADQPTIPSWNIDPSDIPGLGELGQPTTGEGLVEEKPPPNYPSKSQGPTPDKKEDTSQMMESLGKIVSQLQTLQGLTSSLKLLQTMPKDGREAGSTQGVSGSAGVSEGEKAAIKEKELSEDTKRKVAALLANESDSDGEQVQLYKIQL